MRQNTDKKPLRFRLCVVVCMCGCMYVCVYGFGRMCVRVDSCLYIYIYMRPWCNGYRRRKWTG